MKKRWLRRVIIFCVAVVTIMAILLAILHTPPVGDFVFRQLRGVVESAAGFDLRADALQLNLLKGSVRLTNISLRSMQTPELPPILEADAVYAKVGIIDAARGKLVLRELVIERPEVYYFVSPDGDANLPEPAADAESRAGTPPDFLIMRAAATDGSFVYNNTRQRLFVNLPRWLLSIAGDETKRDHTITFISQEESSFEFGNHVVPINSLEFSGILQKSAARLHSLLIATAGSTVEATGSLYDFSSPSLELDASLGLDLGEIAPIAGYDGRVSGVISGAVTASGNFDHIDFSARMEGKDIGTPVFSPVSLDLDTSGEWRASERKLVLRNLDLSTPEGSVTASAELFPGGDGGLNSVAARIRNANLRSIMSRLETPVIAASRADADLSLRWEGEFSPSRIAGNARLDLAAVNAAPREKILPVSASISANMRDDRIDGTIHSLNVFGAKTSGNISLLSFNEIEGKLHGVSPDMQQFLRLLSLFLGRPEGVLGDLAVAGPMNFTAQVSGQLNEPKIAATLDAPSLEAGGFKNLSAKANTVIHRSRMSFENTFTLPLDSSIAVKGEVAFGDSGTFVSIDAAGSLVHLTSLAEITGQEIPAEGEIAFTASLRGPVDKLEGDAAVTGKSMRLYGKQMGDLEATLNLSGNEVRTTQFRLLRNPLDPSVDLIDADIVYRLDSGHFRVQAGGEGLTLSQNASSDASPLEGRIDFALSGEGTIAHPSIDINVNTEDLRIWGKSLGTASVKGALRDDELAVEAVAPRLNLSSAVQLSTSAPYPFTGRMAAKQSDLSLLDLKWREDESLTGSADIEMTFSGNLDELELARGTAIINNLTLHSGETEISTLAPALVAYSNRTIELESPLAFAGIGSTIELSGSIPVSEEVPPGKITLKGVINLKEALDFALQPEEYTLEGNLNLDFSFSGHAHYFESAGAIELNDGSLTMEKLPVPVTDLALKAGVRDGSLIIEKAGATWGEGKISLTGEYPFGMLPDDLPLHFQRKDGPAYLVLELTNIMPEQTGMLPPDVTGIVSLVAAGQTYEMDLRGLSGQVVFRDLSLRMDNIDFRQKEPSLIEVHDGIASLLQLAITGPRTNILARGFAGLYPGAPLDFRVEGDLHSGILTAGIQDVSAAGTLKVGVNVSGSLNDPVLTGYAETNDGMISLRNPRIIADGLKIRLDLTSDGITVQEFTGTLNGGTIDVTGTVGYTEGFL
ncbi:MAG TPA: hypothetical protein VLL97_13285, partial [Acidobacteriota bacterium]|nr:hypothetical protein [Acidobacteriota bacterium]